MKLTYVTTDWLVNDLNFKCIGKNDVAKRCTLNELIHTYIENDMQLVIYFIRCK